MEGPKVLANKETSKDRKPPWEQGQLKYPNPSLVVRSISDKERGRTLERKSNLEKPSPT